MTRTSRKKESEKIEKDLAPNLGTVLKDGVEYAKLRHLVEVKTGMKSDIDLMYNSTQVKTYETNSKVSIVDLMAELKTDMTLPTDADLLANFQLGIGLILEKWLMKFSQYSVKLKKNKNKLKSLEAKIIQEYKRNPAVYNGVLVDEKESRNIVLIHPEYIELLEQINNIEVIMDVIDKAMAQIGSLSFHVNNSINIAKLQIGLMS